MGQVATKICGGSSLLDMLMKKYGEDIGRFIAIEKVKQFLDTKLAELKNTIGSQSGGILNQLTGTIDGKKTQLANTFQNFKQQIDQKVPGGVSTVQKMKGEPIENILGVNEFMKKFDEVKSTATTKFNEQQKNVFNKIDQTAIEQKGELDKQRPSIPLYDQMSSSQQQVVFKEGEKVFATQIQQHQDTLVKQLGDKLNPETYLGNFKNLVPTGSLDGILGNATSNFENIKNLLSGGGIGNVLHGFGL